MYMEKRAKSKFILSGLFLFILLTQVQAEIFPSDGQYPFFSPIVPDTIIETIINNTNNSFISLFFLNLSGTNADQDINISPFDLELTNLLVNNNITIIGNILSGQNGISPFIVNSSGGRIGFGTMSPTTQLDMIALSTLNAGISLQSTGATKFSSIITKNDQGSNQQTTMGIGGTGTSLTWFGQSSSSMGRLVTTGKGLVIGTDTNRLVHFGTFNIESFNIDKDQNVNFLNEVNVTDNIFTASNLTINGSEISFNNLTIWHNSTNINMDAGGKVLCLGFCPQ